MNGQRRIARHNQYASLYVGAQIEADKQKYFLGTAKVDIESFSFDPFWTRDIHSRISERLLSTYELTGTSQLEPTNHIPAVIDDSEFIEALSRWPTLSFPTDKKLQCLRGRHRIDAARVYLRPGLRWWVVNLYSQNLSSDLKNYLTTQTSNEQPISLGEVYFHILRCNLDDDRGMDAWWAQIQSMDERAELKRLFARTRLNAPFRTLSKLHACGRGMLAGSVGSILRLKCDEEIIRYLTHIHDSWAALVGFEESDLGRIDNHTMEGLEGRVPALSKSDADFLKPSMEEGTLFAHFTSTERDGIWQRLLAFPRRVPSMRLFFKDAIYLEILADCLKSLVKPARRQTMYEAFSAAFSTVVDPSLIRADSPEPVSTFEESYRRLVLCTMRQVESLKPGSVMLEKSERRESYEKDPQAWHDLAEEAYHLGFRSEKIDFFRLQDPDRTAAASFLRQRRRSDHFSFNDEDFESLVDQVVAALNRARHTETTTQWPSLTTEGQGENRSRRAGRPFSDAHRHGAKFLTYDHVYRAMPTTQGEPTPFFVQRDIFLAFFGSDPDVDLAVADTQSALLLDNTDSDQNLSENSTPIRSAAGEDSEESDRQYPRFDRNRSIDLIRRLSHTTISSSHYSQPSVETEDPAGPSTLPDVAREEAGADPAEQDSAEPSDNSEQFLRFISLAGPRPEIVERLKLPVTSEGRLEALAASYTSRGMFLYDRRMRSLPPQDYVNDAHLDENRAVFLIPGDRDITMAEVTLNRSLKRVGDDIDSGRPRKMYVV